MFASKAGAKLVIGIDMSNILDQAEKIVRANGFEEDSELSFVSSSRDGTAGLQETRWPNLSAVTD